jgi:hypothetical protein
LNISHASEDKDEFVRPLAKALEQSGLEVWFDETTLKVGEGLRAAIDHGLSRSRFGVVVEQAFLFERLAEGGTRRSHKQGNWRRQGHPSHLA